MTDVSIDDAVLERLIEQFASPYDCLRELVQNGMDAGSSRIEVELHVHGDPGADDVAFELCVIDDGCGMTESVIDGELARLFASSKRADRTKAGGFGVGFVSVFAWRPDAVLLQTGRHGEAWELEFDREARFAKQRLEVPVEGTTVRLIRRGRRNEHATIRAAAHASLWRWCRFCPVEIHFTDIESGHSEVIRDVEVDAEAAASASHDAPDTHVRVAFAVPPRAVLLRHGLVLAEGAPQTLLPRVFAGSRASAEHLQIWADSPSLSTDIGRDHVVDDAGRRLIEQRTVDLLERARRDLLESLTKLAIEPNWTPEVAARYAYLHGHLAFERPALGRMVERAPLIRMVGGGVTSFNELTGAAKWGVVELQVDPSVATTPLSEDVPRIVAFDDARSDWLGTWLGEESILLTAAGALVREVTPAQRDHADLPALVSSVLRSSGMVVDVGVGEFAGAPTRPWAAQLDQVDGVVRVVLPPARPPQKPRVWLDPRHPICRAAADGKRTPLEAVTTLVLGIAQWLGGDYITPHRMLEIHRDALLRGDLP